MWKVTKMTRMRRFILWAVIASVGATVGFLFGAGRHDLLDPIVAAAWVQAVGSVAAILAAIWIDRGAARRAEDERRDEQARDEEERERLKAEALEIMQDVAAMTGRWLEMFKQDGKVDFNAHIKTSAAQSAIGYVLQHQGLPVDYAQALYAIRGRIWHAAWALHIEDAPKDEESRSAQAFEAQRAMVEIIDSLPK